MSTKQIPSDPLILVGGLIYFGRMTDKIRKHARGELREDFHANLGKGMDGRLCNFLHVDYEALKAQVLAGATDEQVLEWCYAQSRRLNADEILIWNDFIAKRGWNDGAAPILEKFKAEAGLSARADIRTLMEFWAVDEGRKT
ncbi:DUF5069 domain-containing protein [Oleiharenicola sp. Vm1]|uniref:DUF5069 domain-containing protein n=1 Tax=Oleiharenicola sp. Vm1 TaxID=3398393 RepID=UPI0039F4AD9B